MNSYFIYNHVRKMTNTVNEIRKNRCIMRKKKEFNMADIEMLDFMMKVTVDCLSFIRSLPAEAESDLKDSYRNWTGLKEHLESRLKWTIEEIMDDKKMIKRCIDKENSRIAHDVQMEKLEQMRHKRLEKAEQMHLKPMSEVIGEGSN